MYIQICLYVVYVCASMCLCRWVFYVCEFVFTLQNSSINAYNKYIIQTKYISGVGLKVHEI